MALVARSLGRVAAPWGAILAVLSGFQVALIAVAASLSSAGEFDRLANIVPSALRPVLGPALMSFGGMTLLGYFDVLIVMIVVQWAIYVSTEPAGEVETGLVDLLLARPIPRHRLVTRSLVVTFGSTLALTLAMGLGTWMGLLLLAPPGDAWPESRLLVLMIAHLTAVAWCFGAAGVAASGWARRRASALAMVAIASMVLYLVDFLGLWWSPMAAVARLSPFFYFHGGPLIAGTADAVRNLTVLGGATIAAVGVAYWRFERRDL
jgi:ABC-type transport system involved in multi-copper enzyme maturation permease subunit